jgi:AraC-like DNA-binding protein
MRYAEYTPAPRVAAIVERFWLLEGSATGSADAIIPDGRVELIFHYGGPFWRHDAGGEAVKQPPSLLVGQMIGPVVLAPDGPAGVAAIRLRPAASRTLLGFSLQDVSGRFVDLELIFPSVRRQFREDVGLTPKTFSRIVRLQAALRRVRQGSPLTDVALACGFYDQAHMTRDFRELASMSPGVWQTHAGDLAPLFVDAAVDVIPS